MQRYRISAEYMRRKSATGFAVIHPVESFVVFGISLVVVVELLILKKLDARK
jgi:hypothetical protein